MGKKSFEAGIVAGVKPVGEKLDRFSQEMEGMRTQQEEITQRISTLSEDIAVKDKLRQLGMENYHDLTELETDEKVILMSLLYWLAREEPPVDYQQKYLSCLGRFLGVLEVKKDISPDVLQSISDTDVHKVFLKIALEYACLGSEDWVLSETTKELINQFEVSPRTREKIKGAAEDELHILGSDGLARKYDVKETSKEKEENQTWFSNKVFYISAEDGYSDIEQSVKQWLLDNGFYFVTEHSDFEKLRDKIGVSIFLWTPVLFEAIYPAGSKCDEIVLDQYGCLIQRTGDCLSIVLDEKFDLNSNDCRKEFLKFYIDICSGFLPGFDSTMQEAKRRLREIEEIEAKAEKGGSLGGFFEGAKKGVNNFQEGVEQTISEQDQSNILWKTGSSILGKLSSISTSVVNVGLDAGKAVVQQTETASAGITGALQDRLFDRKYKKTMQQNILAAKLLEYLNIEKEKMA